MAESLSVVSVLSPGKLIHKMLARFSALKSFSLFHPSLTQKRQDQNQFAIDRINLSPCTWSFCLPKRFVRFVEKFCIGFWPKSKSVEKKKDEARDWEKVSVHIIYRPTEIDAERAEK